VPYAWWGPITPGTPLVVPENTTMGWYGAAPQPQGAADLSDAPAVEDPVTIIPFFVLAVRAYLEIQTVLSMMGVQAFGPASQAGTFLNQYGGTDLQNYLTLLNSKYTMAVKGLTKSDVPAAQDILSFLCWSVYPVVGFAPSWLTTYITLDLWGGTPPAAGPDVWAATAGCMWNGIFGAVSAYPRYGGYDPPPPVPVPNAAPSYIIDILDSANVVAQLGWAFFEYPYVMEAELADWTIPWTQNKVILGNMARWKALYLFNGYDQVLAMIVSLSALTNQPPPPPVLLSDGTAANGNWSARELFSVMNFDGDLLDGVPGGSIRNAAFPADYSLLALVAALDNIANGTWGGHPDFNSKATQTKPIRPLGLRERLAAAAV
jgi:hypothetical protein